MGTTSNYGFPYPSATGTVRVSADMGDLATDIDTRLLFDSSRNRNSLVVAEGFDATAFITQIANTTTATEFLSLPINGAVAGDAYILTYGGTVLNNSGTTRNATIAVKLGATTVFGGNVGSIATSSGNRSYEGEVRVHIASTTSQILTTSFFLGGTSTISMNGGALFFQQNVNTATENLATSKNLVIEITPNLASENYSFRLQYYRLLRLQTT